MADAPANQSAYGDVNPWLIAVLVAVATFMEVLDTTIANVALRYISGGLAVSGDEASWVVTTYIMLANSVVLAASGWIAGCGKRTSFWCAFRCSRSARCSAVLPGVFKRCCCFQSTMRPRRRRPDSCRTIHPRGRISARQAQSGLRTIRHRRRRRTGRGSNIWADG